MPLSFYRRCLYASVLYLYLFGVSVSKMYLKVLEKPTRACKGVCALSIKLNIIKDVDCDEQNKDILCTLNLPPSTTERERNLKSAKVTTGSANNKVAGTQYR